MAPIYLFDLYRVIDDQAKKVYSFLQGDQQLPTNEKKFGEGQLDALQEIKQFLADSYNIKLPKKLRKKLQTEP